MEAQEQDKEMDTSWKEIERTHQRGKIMGGLLIIGIGSLFLARELGAELPEWLYTWKMLLIALGVVTAVKHRFMHPGWLVLVAVGGAFLMNDLYPDMHLKPFLWPVLIIMFGLFILFKPTRKWNQRHYNKVQYWKKWQEQHAHYHSRYHHNYQHTTAFESAPEQNVGDDHIESTTCFGGVKKNIFSKKFKSGEITNIFGGTEINLMQADLEGQATLEVTQVFGGTKLFVPAHWEIKSEVIAILGSVEDKRAVSPVVSNEPPKVLLLVGTTVLGGIEIRTQ